MKITFKLLTLLLFTKFSYCQNIDTVYLDAKWEKSTIDNYLYYRVIEKKGKGLYEGRDYWKTGEIQMSGYFSSLYPQTREGEFKWFSKNGNIVQIVNYRNGYTSGLVKSFDNNGNLDNEYIDTFDSLDNSSRFNDKFKECKTFIGTKLRYPKAAEKDGTVGRVLVQFFVDKTGRATRMSIYKSSDNIFNDESIRVVKLYDKWIVPYYKKNPVSVEVIIPI